MSGEIASWVQAIGSVLAILAGFIFVVFQSWREKRSRVQTLVGLVDAVFLMLVSYGHASKQFSSRSELALLCRRASNDLKGMRQVIFNVDLSAIGSGQFWVAFATFVTALDQLTSALDRDFELLSKPTSDSGSDLEGLEATSVAIRFTVAVSDRLRHVARKRYSVAQDAAHKKMLRFEGDIADWTGGLKKKV